MIKAKIKKTLAGVTAGILILASAQTVMAKSCLDVRDYGYHRYNQRYYDTYSVAHVYTSGAYYRKISGDSLNYVSQKCEEITTVYDKYVHGICVCEEQKIVAVEEDARYVSQTVWYDSYMEVVDGYIKNYY